MKYEKIKKKKKEDRIGKMDQKGPKRQKYPNFSTVDQSSNQNKKNEHFSIEFCLVVGKIQLVTDLLKKIEKYQEHFKNALSQLRINEIRFEKWSN